MEGPVAASTLAALWLGIGLAAFGAVLAGRATLLAVALIAAAIGFVGTIAFIGPNAWILWVLMGPQVGLLTAIPAIIGGAVGWITRRLWRLKR